MAMKEIKSFSEIYKEVLNKIKKGAQIGVLGATLAAGSLLGCTQSSSVDDSQTDTSIVDKLKLPAPYTQDVGGYTLYAAEPYEFYAITKEDGRKAADYYIDQAGTYTKNLANNFENSLANRPNDRDYFATLLDAVKYNQTYNANNIDGLIRNNPAKFQRYFSDIVKALPVPLKRSAFRDSYLTMTDEAYLLGHRSDRGDRISNCYNNHKKGNLDYWNMNNYFKEHADLSNAYATNDFTAVVNLMDNLISEALPTLNARNNTTVTIQDMRQMINLAFADFALGSLHDNSLGMLGHNDQYTASQQSTTHYQMISNAIKEIYAEEQQGLNR
ncbi:MAG: hypothetical protein K2M50_04605 [Treponemataceae bacterium]|nr:hypothetical protein [Treponemataceae bacterium]